MVWNRVIGDQKLNSPLILQQLQLRLRRKVISNAKKTALLNLIAAAAMLKRDPFYNTYIVFRPSGWVDNNGSVFRWCVVKDRQVIPVIGKCRQALEILGITLT